ncbi:hypothetical protein VTJ04DRAFT_86 [Mycothermus thermophilus]|uniref:uncharacterized protein n=1 Tax=Humicola insolens TaxID=85995 RepID=UPI00374492D3
MGEGGEWDTMGCRSCDFRDGYGEGWLGRKGGAARLTALSLFVRCFWDELEVCQSPDQPALADGILGEAYLPTCLPTSTILARTSSRFLPRQCWPLSWPAASGRTIPTSTDWARRMDGSMDGWHPSKGGAGKHKPTNNTTTHLLFDVSR